MKKNLFFITVFLLIVSAVFSQTGKFGLTVNLSNPVKGSMTNWFENNTQSDNGVNSTENSFAIGVIGSFKKDESIIRLRFDLSKLKSDLTSDNYSFGERYYGFNECKQNIFTIAPGIIRVIDFNKIGLKLGFEIPFSIHGKSNITRLNTSSDSLSGTIHYSYKEETEVPTGYSIGIGGIIGFDYNLSNSISIGAEFSSSLLYNSFGGEIKRSYYHQDEFSQDSGTDTFEDKDTGFTFFQNRFSIGISFWF